MPKLTCVCPAELFMAAISALCYTPPARFFSSEWSLFCTWFSYTSGFPSTCTLYLHTALPMRHTCIRISCQSRESFKESLQYNRDAVMRGLHHTASRRVLNVPSQRSRHAFFLAADVESQVNIDATITVRSSHGPSNVRFLGTGYGPCTYDFERPSSYRPTSRLLQPIMMIGSQTEPAHR